MPIDTTNKFLVSSTSEGLVMLNPPRRPLKDDDALLLAAYLVALAGASRDRFLAVFDAVAAT